jgi:hypothetical protein
MDFCLLNRERVFSSPLIFNGQARGERKRRGLLLFLKRNSTLIYSYVKIKNGGRRRRSKCAPLLLQ